jgi:DNA-binding transcriptional LysR family regulator
MANSPSPENVIPAVLKSAAAIFDELRQGVRTIAFLETGTSGEVRIGTTPPLSAAFLPTVVDQVSRVHPKITFEIVQTDVASVHQPGHSAHDGTRLSRRYDC